MIKIFSFLVIIGFCMLGLISTQNKKDMTYNKFIENLNKQRVESVSNYSKSSDKLKVKLKNDETTYIVSNPQTDEFRETLLKNNVEINESKDYSESIFRIVYILLLLLMFYSIFNTLGGKKDKNKIIASNKKFKDVVGQEEIKKDLLNIIDMIKNPERCKKVGARIPKGILLDGPPGNGKTLLAKALAGECGISFYSVNASEFIEKYVGTGARRVRSLFEAARKNAPSIIFIDEIDSIGGKRDGGREGIDKEYTQCLNAILSEMDGFNDRSKILVVAATNRAQDLDEALIRAGRFDMKFTIEKPDYHDRIKILKYYLRDKNCSSDVKYENIAKETTEFSCSEVENLVNIAAFKAVERNSDYIEYADFNNALIEILTHGKVKQDNINEKDFITTCYHEAGHAIMSLLITDNEILRISALPSTSGIGGFTMSVPKDEKKLITLKDIKNEILMLYAGRAAELVMNNKSNASIENFDESRVSIGASSDIEKATELIKYYVSNNTGNDALLNYKSFNVREKDILKQCEECSIKLWKEALNIIRTNFILVENLAYKLMDEKIIYNYRLSNIDLISQTNN